MVIHDGAIVFEHYAGGMTAATRHLCQSVSKSMTSALAGALAAAGRFGVDALVTDYVGELAGTVWEGCTVQHLLDMTAGVSFDESDYDDMDSEAWRGFRALGWLERLPDDPSPAEYVAGLRRQAEHGAEFEYRSICTDVLGWCLERATGRPMAELFSEYIWKPLGAAHEGDFILGPGGFPLADGGFCVTLHDLALFGLLYLQEGEIDGHRVLPREWVRRLRTTDPRLVETYARAYPDEADGRQVLPRLLVDRGRRGRHLLGLWHLRAGRAGPPSVEQRRGTVLGMAGGRGRREARPVGRRGYRVVRGPRLASKPEA